MERGREPACPPAPFIPHLERQSAYTWPPGGSVVALSPVAPQKWQQQRGSGCPSLAAKAQTWLLRIPQQARSQEEPQFFSLMQKNLKIRHRSLSKSLLPFPHPCVFSPWSVHPSVPWWDHLPCSLAYLAFLRGLGSTGAFHSHQSRLLSLEKAKCLFCTRKSNAVRVYSPFPTALLFAGELQRPHNLAHFDICCRCNLQVCPQSYLSGTSGFL